VVPAAGGSPLPSARRAKRGGVPPSDDANRPGPTGPGVASAGRLRQGWPPVADSAGRATVHGEQRSSKEAVARVAWRR
jgi:hypothetical protein